MSLALRENNEIETAISDWGPFVALLAGKSCSPADLNKISQLSDERESYAGRFAAKEAFLKALKTGWRGKITWADIEILNDADGVPAFAVTGEAKRLLTETGAAAVHLSISHTAEHAVAQVIFEK